LTVRSFAPVQPATNFAREFRRNGMIEYQRLGRITVA
jgi:hypothetical protein